MAGGPWDHAYKDGKHDVIITDELIKSTTIKKNTSLLIIIVYFYIKHPTLMGCFLSDQLCRGVVGNLSCNQ